MNKQEVMKLQTCVLRVNIHCDGCKKKVKKLLQKIEGVYTVAIDAEQGKVTVTGNIDQNKLIQKLEKSGKHAEPWGPSKNFSNQNNNNNLGFNPQMFKNMQFENGKLGKLEYKTQNNQKQNQQQQIMKGLKDMKAVPGKEQKTVKFNLPEEEDEFGSSGDDFDEFGDDDEGFSDEFGHGHDHRKPSKQLMNGGGQNGKKGSKGKDEKDKNKGGGAKKAGGIFGNVPFLMKGFGKKSKEKDDIRVGGKKKKGGGDGKNKGGGDKDGGGKKDGGGYFGDFGKIGEFGESVMKSNNNNNNGNGNGKKGNGGIKNKNNNNGMVPQANKKPELSFNNGMSNRHAADHHRGGGGGGGGDGYMGQMGPMGGYPMGQMGGTGAVQGRPAAMSGGGGYYQNPYQQPYMGMNMMSQQYYGQGGHGGNEMMYQPMMYARQPQPVGYVPPMPPPAVDPYVHMFSDENAGGCSIM